MAEEDALLREVDEELRRERLEQLWKRYGNLFLAFSVGIVLAVAAFKGWQYYRQKQAQQAGERFVAALDAIHRGEAGDAIAQLQKLATGKHAGAAAVAKLRLAALLAGRGERERAIALYRMLENDENIELPLRNAARVRHAWLLVDTADPKELAKLLGGLEVAGNPWRASAREILALAALREGDAAAAKGYLKQLIDDPETPVQSRGRAAILARLIERRTAAGSKAGR